MTPPSARPARLPAAAGGGRGYLFGPQSQSQWQSQPVPDWVEHTPDWPAVEAAIGSLGDPD